MNGRLRIRSDGSFAGTRVEVVTADGGEPIHLPVTAASVSGRAGEAYRLSIEVYPQAIDVVGLEDGVRFFERRRLATYGYWGEPCVYAQTVLEPAEPAAIAVHWNLPPRGEATLKLELDERLTRQPAREIRNPSSTQTMRATLHRRGLPPHTYLVAPGEALPVLPPVEWDKWSLAWEDPA